ncbi:IPT/TIG domain-containing protein, partial [Streptomyces sioyaensis]|uniref:IPT/TIG domain-containing protein n=1 Tax=Streptomyces sioyaensis TaxID=67364 RepID=UPI003406BEFB
MPPTVSSLSPTSGTTAGQVLFTITGTNLGVAGSTTVTFGGGAQASQISINGAQTTLTGRTPAHVAGTVPV